MNQQQQQRYKDAYLKAEDLYEQGRIKNKEWWEHYRLFEEIDPRVHARGEHFTDINDLTDDFDYPEDYERFIKYLNESKQNY